MRELVRWVGRDDIFQAEETAISQQIEQQQEERNTMSWDVSLYDHHGVIVSVPPHQEGGTFAGFGQTDASLNITYNYTPLYTGVGYDSPYNMLHGRTAADTMPALRELVKKLGTIQSDDYWEATPGNAGHAMHILLGWAALYPDATWRVE